MIYKIDTAQVSVDLREISRRREETTRDIMSQMNDIDDTKKTIVEEHRILEFRLKEYPST